MEGQLVRDGQRNGKAERSGMGGYGAGLDRVGIDDQRFRLLSFGANEGGKSERVVLMRKGRCIAK